MEQKPFSHRVVMALEFAGFGPCVAASDYSIKAQCRDKVFEVFFRAGDGGIQGEKRRMMYQNPVDPLVHAVFSVIHKVYVDYGGLPAPDDTTVVRFNDKFVMRVNYLWCDDPIKHTKLVLHELLVDNLPVWNMTASIPYNASEDEDFWDRSISLLREFKEKGKYSELMHPSDLQKAIIFCETGE